jgi:hypothetical protein
MFIDIHDAITDLQTKL